MALYNYFFVFLIALFSTSFVECAEFVPVYMWGTNKLSEHVSALHKISQDSFKDTLLECLKKDPFVIVFAERTLSPEDFAQRDQNGQSAFVNLQELKKEGYYVSYRPYVQNAVGAIKQVSKPVTEISISNILSSVNVPKENIWIINLDDARDDETRFHMLKRHDADIVTIYKNALKQHDNVLVLYTANHTAWVAPDDVTHSKTRLLLEDEQGEDDESFYFSSDNTLLYMTGPGSFNHVKITKEAKYRVVLSNESYVKLSLVQDTITIEFEVTTGRNYWYLTATVNSKPLNGMKSMYAPIGFSYHCGGFNTSDGTASLVLPGFQFQPFLKINDDSVVKFGDAYDCVGFTSVPIWSGLFVTALLLLIITSGLTMMMDIKTMDRFDDPKGKTITISATE